MESTKQRTSARLRLGVLLAFLLIPGSGAAQLPDPGDGGKADDAVRRAILSGSPVPTTILEIRQRLARELEGKLNPHIVVNGGHDNPAGRDPAKGVKFMVFETYQGPPGVDAHELFIGYFLGPRPDGVLGVLDGFIELIAWDRTKQAYNFWEVLRSRWHYRGDSNDVLADVAQLNLGASKSTFPDRPRLRCSGCHTLGAPIMKELEPPHNDWWTTAGRLKLEPFALRSGTDPMNPVHVAAGLFADAADASDLSRHVKQGIDRLVQARAAQGVPPLRQRLRSLFGTMEMNLVSDSRPFQEPGRPFVDIPVDFFVDRRLAGDRGPIRVSGEVYREALRRVGSQFAPQETPGLLETHHAFVVPARSYIDNRVIESLIAQGLVDDELVADILAVDFTTPVYSRSRSPLIKYVPERAKDTADLREQLVAALEKAPKQDRAARELLTNLTDGARTAGAHRGAESAYLDARARVAGNVDVVVDWLKVASQRRLELEQAETARHPEGNIKEAGFRVVFPVDRLKPRSGELRLDPATGRAVPNS